MATFTPQQAANLAGGTIKDIKPISGPSTQPTPQPKGFLSRLGSGISEAFGQRGKNISESFQTDQGIQSKAFQTVGQVAGGIGDIATETVKAGFQSLPQGVQDVTKSAGVAVLNTAPGKVAIDALQGGMETWERFKEADPETAKNVEAVLNIASILPIGKAGQLGAKGVVKAGETGLEIAGKTKGAVKKLVGTAELTPEQTIAKAIEDATPSYEALSKSKKAKANQSMVEEGKFLEGRKFKPTKLQKEAGQELANVPGYNPAATALEKFKLVSREVKKQAIDLDDALGAEKIIVPKREVAKRINDRLKKIPGESLLIQKSDPLIKSYYEVVKNGFKKVDGTTKGILDLRKILDKAYENAGGKFPMGSEKLAALDAIHREVRDELTQTLIDKSNQEVANALRKQWNLYRAADEIKLKVAAESGSVVGRTAQKFPKITKALKAVGNLGGGIGIGTGIGLAD